MARPDSPVRRAAAGTARGTKPAQAPPSKAPQPADPQSREQHAADERAEAGKAHRLELPRSHHASWKKSADRADPIDILQAQDADRLQELVPIRYGRMLQSPFTFFRGAAAIMAADLAKTPTTGHRVQACGDCHLMNFGGFATPERNILFDINDFDETLPAPWEWDVKRLVASFVLAARSSSLSDAKARDIAVSVARSYRKNLRKFAKASPLEVWYSRITAQDMIDMVPVSRRDFVRARIEKAMERGQNGSELDFPKLAGIVGGRAAIRDAPPLIFHPDIARSPDFTQVLQQVFDDYRATLPDDRRVLLDRYVVVDAAIKVVGIGSVGRRCWIALLMSAGNDPLFLQFKEAVASVMEPYAGKSAYAHCGQRVVEGQRLMQPSTDIFLGWVTAPATGKQFYVRQLRDAKIKPLVETFDFEMLELFGEACGAVLARAHAKASDVAEIGGYLGSNGQFDEAMGGFAIAYADQAERDHSALKAAVRKGRINAYREAE